MRRVLAASAIAVAVVSVPASAAPGLPEPGGQCDGIVDTMCRSHACGELDCGLIPPCLLWVYTEGCVIQ